MPSTDGRAWLGLHGETLACAELERRGYAIVERRARTRRGELDIIARDGKTLVFVEVKTRSSSRFGTGEEAITRAKRRTMTRLAAAYLGARRLSATPCRFDVVSIVAGDPVRIDVVQGAFDAEDG